jgi:predicted RNase H-like nuclease (RuvC/YqgF family)
MNIEDVQKLKEKANDLVAEAKVIARGIEAEVSTMSEEEKKDAYIKMLEIDIEGLKGDVKRRDETIENLLKKLDTFLLKNIE